MLDERTFSQHALRLLSLFHSAPECSFYGRELSRAAGVPSATVVRLLLKLEHEGWLSSEFERGPRTAHRAKRYYRLTRKGFERSRGLLKQVAKLDIVKEGPQPRLLEVSEAIRPLGPKQRRGEQVSLF